MSIRDLKHDLLNKLAAAKLHTEVAKRSPGLTDSVRNNLERTLANLLEMQDLIESSDAGSLQPFENSSSESAFFPAESKSNEKGVILLIDDSDDIRLLFKAVLQPRGYKVFVAENEPEAVSCLEKERVDLILLDYQLKGKTGIEVLDTLYQKNGKNFRASKVVLFSGYGDLVQDARVAAVENKAMDISSIVRMVEKHCTPRAETESLA